MEAKLIRKSEGRGLVENLHFVISINNKEIPLITLTLDSLYTGQQELGGFGFELCECTADEAQAVFKCYLKHARLLNIYFRACHQIDNLFGNDDDNYMKAFFRANPEFKPGFKENDFKDLINWGFLSDFETKEVTHKYYMLTDDSYREDVDAFKLQQKKEKKELEKNKKQNRQTYIYLMRDHVTKLIKIGRSIKPEFRERTLYSKQPNIELIYAWIGTVPEENELHKEFITKRGRGEWFALTEEDIEKIKARFAEREQWKSD